jgi:alginate O-acetyltransferase complex protein AlgI
MLFNTGHFFVFLLVVLALHYTLPRPARKWILLAASYYFYMCWNAKFVLLLMTLTVIDFFAAQWVYRTEGTRRKLALITSLSANLSFLGFFKYYNFLADALCLALARPPHSFFLSVVLPVGISFHTFQSMSYVIDVYRREQEPIRNPIDYALFIAFFPQLVAGPIVRAREFFGDFYHWRRPTAEEVQRGVLMVAIGLMKKMALADQFAIICDRFYANPAAYPGVLSAWTGAMSFAIQVYFDFSGYTDIAIGSAKLLGFHFPENFHRPFLSSSTTELWRRWHLSLSRWLRDYLYFPLGGSRLGRWKTYRNLMITMFLGGLWHGAGWNYVLWGGSQGVLLAIERFWHEKVGWRIDEEKFDGRFPRPLRIVGTFLLFSFCLVIFRSPSFKEMGEVFRQMFSGSAGHVLFTPYQTGLIALWMGLEIWEEQRGWFERLVRAPSWALASALTVVFLCIEIFGVTDVSIPFIYFQF